MPTTRFTGEWEKPRRHSLHAASLSLSLTRCFAVQHVVAEVPQEQLGLMEALDHMVSSRLSISQPPTAMLSSGRAERLSVDSRRSMSSRSSIGEVRSPSPLSLPHAPCLTLCLLKPPPAR